MTSKVERWFDGIRRRRSCRFCKGPHRWQDCEQSYGAVEHGPSSDKSGGVVRSVVCFKCGKPGHWARDCHLNTRRVDEAGAQHPATRRRLHEPERLPATPGNVATAAQPVTWSEPVELSAEQQTVLEHVRSGRSVFFTGCAGTGKSLLLRQIVATLREQHPGDGKVAVCASTGIAAVQIGGTTVHSWAGVGLGEGSPGDLLARVKRSNQKSRNWLCTKVLVIDEISMLDGNLLDALDFIGRGVRRNDAPFGGLQVVLCGDFFQLPPVGLERGTASWCFDSECWGRLLPRSDCFVLRRVFRQREAAFVRLLDEVRHGSSAMSSLTCNMLCATRQQTFEMDIEPTKLFSHNADVDRINETRLGQLESPAKSFTAVDSGTHPYLGQLQKNCMAPVELNLKVGAQVMLLKNIDPGAGLVNGTRGVVQGFEPSGAGGEMLPVVRMHVAGAAGHDNGSGCVMTRRLNLEEWTIELSGSVVARRRQIPLRLAWAISIHKSQGMTIDALEVDLGRIFEYGQAYVALSRATSLSRLRALNFDSSLVKTHPRVVEFSRTLEAQAQVQYCDNKSMVEPLEDDSPQLQAKAHETIREIMPKLQGPCKTFITLTDVENIEKDEVAFVAGASESEDDMLLAACHAFENAQNVGQGCMMVSGPPM